MTKKTKQVNCIACDTLITVSVFASPKSAKCDGCKTGKSVQNVPRETVPQQEIQDVPRETKQPQVTTEPQNIDAYGESTRGPRIDGAPSKALARLACPFHPSEQMTIIGVTKSSQWGDIIDLQCRKPGCWTKVSISEQSKKHGYAIQTTGCGTDFEPADVIDALENGKIRQWHNDHKGEIKDDNSSDEEKQRENVPSNEV